MVRVRGRDFGSRGPFQLRATLTSPSLQTFSTLGESSCCLVIRVGVVGSVGIRETLEAEMKTCSAYSNLYNAGREQLLFCDTGRGGVMCPYERLWRQG